MALDPDSSLKSLAMSATHPMNDNTLAAVSIDLPIHERLAQELSVAAAQLIEAAFKARGGDCDSTHAHIAHAIALLKGMPSLGPRSTPASPITAIHRDERGGLPAWQTRKVIAHVQGNLSRRIRVQELAQLLGLSASHFCRAFKCAFGASPRDYVLRRRIEVAQAMMLTTREPLHAIAASCGMCDQQHFTRSFRRIVGESPSMWRRSRRGTLNVD